jgi:predicted negative regulator of RcsB-dependent stress response
MRTKSKWQLVMLAGLALVAQTARANQQTDHLRDLAKQAKEKGDLDQAASDLCQAANIDPSHYQKKCDHARADAEKQAQLFEGYFKTGNFEFQQKDYAGAVRDLGKIDFGPRREEAQSLIQQAKAALQGGSAPSASQAALLRGAQTAYDHGDFDAATAQASQVQSPALQAAAKQLLTNIKVYQDTITQGDLLAHNGDYKGAQEKYSFAIKIKANGPGSPAGKLQAMQAKLQEATANPQPGTQTVKPEPPSPPKVDYAAKVKNGLAEARRNEQNGNLKAALRGFQAVLVLDGLQPEALAGKQRVTAELQGDPKALADGLEDGIRSYYASQFEQAAASISLYLNGGGLHHKGAAHFYLGASLLSQAILADPHDHENQSSLRQNADEQFQMARQENYMPVEKLVSPRILAEWAKGGSQQ